MSRMLGLVTRRLLAPAVSAQDRREVTPTTVDPGSASGPGDHGSGSALARQ
jgi:hypothetical protein